jgi:hypothetical protein
LIEICKADPTCLITLLELHTDFLHTGSWLYLADLDAGLVFTADAGFHDLGSGAIHDHRHDLTIDLINTGETE